MDPRDFLSFIYRRFLPIVLVIVIGAVCALGYTLKYDKGAHGALIFLTLGMEVEEGTPADSYVTNESHNVIDQFTETVQGWLFNPALLGRVNELAGNEVGLSVRKQEKQNLLVTVSVEPGVDSEAASQVVLMVLEEEIEAYNAATNAGFVLALSSISALDEEPQHVLNVVIGMLLAAIFMIVGLLLWEYIERRVSFAFQVENILGVPPLARLNSEKYLSKLDVDDSILVIKLGETSEDYLHELARLAQGVSIDYILIV